MRHKIRAHRFVKHKTGQEGAAEQSFADFVAVNHRTRPAAETAVAATGSAGVNLDRALTVRALA